MPASQSPAFLQLHQRQHPGILYHYCGPEALLGIVRDRQIWASSSHHQNDVSEQVYACEVLRQQARIVALDHFGATEDQARTAADLLISRAEQGLAFLACFSEKADLLSQWRGYTPSSGGFAVGFAPGAFEIDSGWLLTHCEYNPGAQREIAKALLEEHVELLDPKTDIETLMAPGHSKLADMIVALLTIVPGIKHPGFSEENEWRLVRHALDGPLGETEFRVARGQLIPYQRIKLRESPCPLAEIVIGPSPDARTRTYGTVLMLLNRYGLRECDVRVSEIEYRGI
jgi:hypothetical protein